MQLVRVERGNYSEGVAREATEVQNLQIADGDVPPNIPIPLHMIFPRVFSCRSLTMQQFQIDFEINLIISFEDNHVVSYCGVALDADPFYHFFFQNTIDFPIVTILNVA